MNYRKSPALIILACSLIFSCSNGRKSAGHEITPDDIKAHITFLAGDNLEGRETGTPGAAKAANYIADKFSEFGLVPAGDNGTYFQEFTVNMSRFKSHYPGNEPATAEGKRIARNVAGLVEGTEKPGQYIIIGAHYDHLGYGTSSSFQDNTDPKIHNGADDNASGTAGLIELAQYFNRRPIQRSILFIAFSGEELGLLGSRYFVNHPTVSLNKTMAMINMDMIGRLTDNRLLILGTGSSDRWPELIEHANIDSLKIQSVPEGSGASDHTSFYNSQIPVLHYFTDTHSDYHRPSDDPHTINVKGEEAVLEHLKRLVQALDKLSSSEFAYKKTSASDNRPSFIQGLTLGVMPDYSFDGKGMRITGVNKNGPADKAGLQSGDIILRLDSKEIKDIYTYMEVLNKLTKGDRTTATIIRDGEEKTLVINL